MIMAPFRLAEKILKFFSPFKWLEKDMPLKGKIIIAALLLAIFGVVGYGSFRFYDFTQNNPNFCVSCHLMKEAFETWEASVHQEINCHECHHLAVEEMNQLLISFVFHRPEEVPDRHGKVIVPWKQCIKCHWETDEEYAEATHINQSRLHAKHYFMEQIECSKCHGYRTHKFVPEDRFCVRCHQGKLVHGMGMEELACLNCHTDRTPDLRPGRNKCLFCHDNESIRQALVEGGTLDVTHYQPPEETVKQAIKIKIPKDAPMQFQCYLCHKPHEAVRPDWGNCINCHRNVMDVGKHGLHVQMMGLQCNQCHKPHGWAVTEANAKQLCGECHPGGKSPKQFLEG
jgi:nitrate reductase cytochrome c-type subunit